MQKIEVCVFQRMKLLMFASQKNMMSSKSMGRCWPDLLRRRVRLFKCHGYTNSVISEGGKNLSA